MTKTFDRLHPIACACRHCRAPLRSANIAPSHPRRFHPIAYHLAAGLLGWFIIGALVALVCWGAAQ